MRFFRHAGLRSAWDMRAGYARWAWWCFCLLFLLSIVQPLICKRRNTPIIVMPDLIWHPELSSMPANFRCASSRRCFFCCLVLFLLLSLLCDCWPVVDRRLLTFLASPRRVSKRRRRKVAVPAGCPIVQVVKWEKFETRYAQTRTFLIHFLPSTSGSATCGKRRSTHP